MPEGGQAVSISDRRMARELALRTLYQCSLRKCPVDEVATTTLRDQPLHPDGEELYRSLVTGVSERLSELDEFIEPHLAKEWEIHRLPVIEHCVLRMAAYELYRLPDTPPKVTINEAVILAKRYGGADSGKFVNGVLGSLLRSSPKASWERPPTSEESQAAAEIEPDLEVVETTPEEFAEAQKTGRWTLRSPGESEEAPTS